MKAWIRKLALRHVRSVSTAIEPSPYVMAKGFRELRLSVRNGLMDIALLTVGVFSAAFGLEGFLIPNGFIDGGATGVALMALQLTHLPLPVLLIVVNIPFVYLAFRLIGRNFALRTAAGICALALVTSTVHMPQVTQDKLLVAVFGGFFLGAGIGLAVRGGGVIDGTEVVAIALSRKLRVSIGDVITAINVLIFALAAWLLGTETAMYSMITYLAASKTVDLVIEGIDEYMGVTIISAHDLEIHDMITQRMGRGLTIYRGKRGIGKDGVSKEVDILYCVITRLEMGALTEAVEKIDPNAFVVMSPVKDTSGGIMKTRRHKH